MGACVEFILAVVPGEYPKDFSLASPFFVRCVICRGQVFVGFNSISTLDGAILLRVSGGLTEFHIQVRYEVVV